MTESVGNVEVALPVTVTDPPVEKLPPVKAPLNVPVVPEKEELVIVPPENVELSISTLERLSILLLKQRSGRHWLWLRP